MPTQEQPLPTQDKKVGFDEGLRTSGRSSIYDQETQKPDQCFDIDDDDEKKSDDATHQHDNERSTLYDTATEVYAEDNKEQQ